VDWKKGRGRDLDAAVLEKKERTVLETPYANGKGKKHNVSQITDGSSGGGSKLRFFAKN